MKPIIKPTKGKLLISEPVLYDSYFNRSVVLLGGHDDEGSFGVIINKPINIKLNDVVKDFPEFDTQPYLGGPVQTDNLFILHTLGEQIGGSIKIMEGIHWGGDIDTIKELIDTKQITPDEIRFYIGYAGWEPKQLDKELKKNSWVVTHAKSEHVMTNRPQKMWSNFLKSFGKDYEIWANAPVDPLLN